MSAEEEVNSIALNHVEFTSREFHALATAVSEKLKAFLEWLNGLPGHTSTELFKVDPDQDQDPIGDGRGALGLQIDRGKGGWQLYYAYSRFDDQSFEHVHNVEPNEWMPLEEAPLAVRCAALSMLPALIKKMHAEQSGLILRLRSANSALDRLAKGRNGKERA
jgi:hypothetical protein